MYGAALAKAGLKKGKVIMLLMPPYSIETPIIVLGVWAVGGIVCFGNPDLAPLDLKHQVREARVDFVLCIPENVSMISSAVAGIEKAPITLTLGQVEDYTKDINALLAQVQPLESYPQLKADGSDPAGIHFTSGTTGKPKAVVFSHKSARNWLGRTIVILKEDTESYFLNGLRTVQVGILVLIELLLTTKCKAIVGDFSNPHIIANYIEKMHPRTIDFTVGQWMQFFNHPNLKELHENGLLDCVR